MTKHCFAHNHMTLREYALWTRIRELYAGVKKKHPTQTFIYFDGVELAKQFRNTPVSTLYKTCATLVKEGWFEIQGEQKRRKDGAWGARKVTPLAHKEWILKYPRKCLNLQESHFISESGEKQPNHSISENNHSISENNHYSPVEKDLSIIHDMVINTDALPLPEVLQNQEKPIKQQTNQDISESSNASQQIAPPRTWEEAKGLSWTWPEYVKMLQKSLSEEHYERDTVRHSFSAVGE